MNALLILLGKLLSVISRFLNVGSGSTWPGHIALNFNKNFIKEIINKNPHLKIILIAGTNGKTTTVKLIQTILEYNEKKVFQNSSGSNLLNGVASTLALHSTVAEKINRDFAIFEIDENTLPLVLKELTADYVILLNLFRDQLDRYGEINAITKKWGDVIAHLPPETKLILNADDPQIASLALHLRGANVNRALFFGLNGKKFSTSKLSHAVDSTHCPNCGKKLIYKSIYFSHLGDWECKKCGHKHPGKIFTDSPSYPLVGIYNEYNTNAAVLVAKQIGISEAKIKNSLQEFKPAFGRQEILNVNGKKVQIFLSKNPTGFNESLKTIADLGALNLLLVLNDRIPDGRDVSWIWDVDTEEYIKRFKTIVVSGDRAYDMVLRIKYSSEFPISNFKFPINSQISNSKFQIVEDLKKAIVLGLEKTPKSEILYILPTYSAMLEVRKILTGKKIL